MRRDADKRRGSARARGYSARWDREAVAFKRVHPLCVGCLAVGLTRQADVVDHIVPHRGDQALMWAWENLQSACADHHNVVKQRLEALFDAGQIDRTDLSLASERAKRLTNELMGGWVKSSGPG